MLQIVNMFVVFGLYHNYSRTLVISIVYQMENKMKLVDITRKQHKFQVYAELITQVFQKKTSLYSRITFL